MLNDKHISLNTFHYCCIVYLHACLFDLSNTTYNIVCGFQMKCILISSCICHAFYPLQNITHKVHFTKGFSQDIPCFIFNMLNLLAIQYLHVESIQYSACWHILKEIYNTLLLYSANQIQCILPSVSISQTSHLCAWPNQGQNKSALP